MIVKLQVSFLILALLFCSGLNAKTWQGEWKTITAGHKLIYLDSNRLLDWEQKTGKHRVWYIDRHAPGSDTLPVTLLEGKWMTIRSMRELV